MRILRPIIAACFLALAFHATACTKKNSETTSTSYSEKSTTKELKVTNVDLGRNIGGDKHVTETTTTFSPNDVIYASVQTSGTAPNASQPSRWVMSSATDFRANFSVASARLTSLPLMSASTSPAFWADVRT